MAFCFKCGNQLQKGTAFCPNCGANQINASPNSNFGYNPQFAPPQNNFNYANNTPKTPSPFSVPKLKNIICALTAIALLVLMLVLPWYSYSSEIELYGYKVKNYGSANILANQIEITTETFNQNKSISKSSNTYDLDTFSSSGSGNYGDYDDYYNYDDDYYDDYFGDYFGDYDDYFGDYDDYFGDYDDDYGFGYNSYTYTDYDLSEYEASLSTNFRNFGFVIAKIFCIIAIVFFSLYIICEFINFNNIFPKIKIKLDKLFAAVFSGALGIGLLFDLLGIIIYSNLTVSVGLFIIIAFVIAFAVIKFTELFEKTENHNQYYSY